MDKELEAINSRCYEHLIEVTEQMDELMDVMCTYIQMVKESSSKMLNLSKGSGIEKKEKYEAIDSPVMMLKVHPDGTIIEFPELSLDDDAEEDELGYITQARSFLKMEFREEDRKWTESGRMFTGDINVYKVNDEGAILPLSEDECRQMRVFFTERALKVPFNGKKVWMMELIFREDYGR